jgi:hypothetical protein
MVAVSDKGATGLLSKKRQGGYFFSCFGPAEKKKDISISRKSRPAAARRIIMKNSFTSFLHSAFLFDQPPLHGSQGQVSENHDEKQQVEQVE